MAARRRTIKKKLDKWQITGLVVALLMMLLFIYKLLVWAGVFTDKDGNMPKPIMAIEYAVQYIVPVMLMVFGLFFVTTIPVLGAILMVLGLAVGIILYYGTHQADAGIKNNAGG